MKTESTDSQSEPLQTPRKSCAENDSKTPQESKSDQLVRIREILVPMDFSEHSDFALQYAISFAEQVGARITLLHVFEPTASFPDSVYTTVVSPNQIGLAKEELAARASRIIGSRAKSKSPLIRQILATHGIASDAIIETAITEKSDLIILATHGRTGLAHILLGSTAEKIVREAPCPVLVVRVRQHRLVTN